MKDWRQIAERAIADLYEVTRAIGSSQSTRSLIDALAQQIEFDLRWFEAAPVSFSDDAQD